MNDFRVDIILADGTNVGTSVNILNLDDTKKLDSIGSLSFSIPASDPITENIQTGVSFEVYDRIDGFIGTYLFNSKTISDKNGVAVLNVKCDDALKELTFLTVGFNRNYNYEDVATVIDDIVTLASGWTTSIESGLGQTVISYQGESILRALDEQRDRNSAHFRLTGNRVLEFGYFGEQSSAYLTQLNGVVQGEFSVHPETAIVSSISANEDSQEIYNRIIPLGFGQGVSQLTIVEATLGDYDIETGVNVDDSLYYYIEDSASIASYGLRTRILSLPNIRPISNSDANVINAANALKLTAEAYLTNHANPRNDYNVQVVGLRQEVKVGDIIRLTYKGVVDNFNYISVNDFFYIMDVTKSRDVDGNRYCTFNLSSINERRTADQDVIVDVVRDLRDIHVKIPATLAYSPVGPYTRRIKGDTTDVDRVNAIFEVRIKDEVLYLNRAIMRVATETLKSSVRTSVAGGSSTTSSEGGGDHGHIIGQIVNNSPGGYSTRRITLAMESFTSPVIVNADIAINASVAGVPDDYIVTATASGEHTHDVDIPSHTHAMVYNVFADTNYPQELNFIIDGSDVTADLVDLLNDSVAPFAPTNIAYEYEFDITDYLINSGLRQTHSIEIFSSEDSKGELVFEVDMLVTIQPIRVA